MMAKILIISALTIVVLMVSGCTIPPKDCGTSANCIMDAVTNCIPAEFEINAGLISFHVNVIGKNGNQCEIEEGMGLSNNKCLLNATNGKFNYDDVTECETKRIESIMNESLNQSLGSIFEEENLSECPYSTKTASFSFELSESESGKKIIFLLADFITQLKLSDNWILENEPIMGTYTRDRFYCDIGTKTGQSINKLYCSGILYKPTLRRNSVDSDGNIIKTEYLYVKELIFDITGKDIQNIDNLKDLKLESVTCSDQYPLY